MIPGRCELSIDIRAGDDRGARRGGGRRAGRDRTHRRAAQGADRCAARAAGAGAPCAPELQQQFSAAITRVTGDAAPLHLPSGAGHDAMKMATITPIGMLFVRCGNGGISHNPDEIDDRGRRRRRRARLRRFSPPFPAGHVMTTDEFRSHQRLRRSPLRRRVRLSRRTGQSSQRQSARRLRRVRAPRRRTLLEELGLEVEAASGARGR